jgi:hypothetical protein
MRALLNSKNNQKIELKSHHPSPQDSSYRKTFREVKLGVEGTSILESKNESAESYSRASSLPVPLTPSLEASLLGKFTNIEDLIAKPLRDEDRWPQYAFPDIIAKSFENPDDWRDAK